MVQSIAMIYQHFNLGTQLKCFKYSYLNLIILFNITHSFAHSSMVQYIAKYHNQFNYLSIICLHTVK